MFLIFAIVLVAGIAACGSYAAKQTATPKEDAITSMAAIDSEAKTVTTSAAIDHPVSSGTAILQDKKHVSKKTVHKQVATDIVRGGNSSYAGDEAVLNQLDSEMDGLLNDLDVTKQEDAADLAN